MKRSAFIFAAVLLIMSCKKDSDPQPQKGCLTGIRTGETTRSNIRCCTRDEFLAGGNVARGGTSEWNFYTKQEWKAVGSCSECQ